MKTQDKITKLEKQLAELKIKLEQEIEANKNKTDWIDLKVWKGYEDYEISSKPLFLNKNFEEQKAGAKSLGGQIASYELLQNLRNSKLYPESFNDFWVNVSPNPDKISEEKGYVARFFADPDWAYLGCDGVPAGRSSWLGVFVVRKKVKK